MSFETIQNAITARFFTLIDDAGEVGTAQYDNQVLDLPEEEVTCKVSVVSGQTRQTTIGVDQFRTVGIMQVEIFSPLGSGATPGLTLADSIVTNFRNKTTDSGNVRFKTPSLVSKGRVGNTWRIIVNCPYWVDET